MRARLVALAVCLMPLAPTGAGRPPVDQVSRPAGFLRLEVPSNGWVHVAMPFEPFAAGLDDQLAGQLTGAAGEAGADAVVCRQVREGDELYPRVFKRDHTGDPDCDGHWFDSLDSPAPTSLTLGHGGSLWIYNAQDRPQSVLLSGEVPLADRVTYSLPDSLQTPNVPLGYPFASACTLTELQIDPGDASRGVLLEIEDTLWGRDFFAGVWVSGGWRWLGDSGATNRVIPVGQGFLLSDWGDARSMTSERPYDAPFPVQAGHRPRIINIRPSAATGDVDLVLLGMGDASETLDIFWQDCARTNGFRPLCWKLAGRVRLPGTGMHVWTDRGDADRPSPGATPLRFYLLGRTDTDLDNDAQPDARQYFMEHAQPEMKTVASPKVWERRIAPWDRRHPGRRGGARVRTHFFGDWLRRWHARHARWPGVVDTDRDGASDEAELLIFGTDPLDAGSDEDGVSTNAPGMVDRTEPEPLDPDPDGDHDGLPDDWERQNQLNPEDPDDARADEDGDGLSNKEEWARGCDVRCTDTDRDGLSDAQEVQEYGTNPLVADCDEDSLDDGEEVQQFGTNPLVADSDGDGLADGTEALPFGHGGVVGTDKQYCRITSGVVTEGGLGETAEEARNWERVVWADLPGSAMVDGFASLPVGFGFPVGSRTWNSIYVGIHGAIGFESPAYDHDNERIPSERLPATAFMPFWDDLVIPAGGSVRHALLETPSGRCRVIEWRDVSRYYTPSTRLTFQARLHATGVVEYRYLVAEGPAADGCSATIGLQIGDPELAVSVANCATGAIAAGRFTRFEFAYRTSPLDPDCDDDGMPDGWEVRHGLNPVDAADRYADLDGDGLYNLEEYLYGADPGAADADHDGLPEFAELFVFHSDPNAADLDLAAADPDGDGLSNAEECAFGPNWAGSGSGWLLCDPFAVDSDRDGLWDGEEVRVHRTSPVKADTDRDGLPDGWEFTHGRDPLDPADGQTDSDGDGLADGCEWGDWGSSPFLCDSDGDGVGDGVEADEYPLLSPVRDDRASDLDADGASNLAEYLAGTSGELWDTDGDAAADGIELALGRDPLDPSDGIRDSDGDRVPDAFEWAWGSDPNDRASVPATPFVANGAGALAETIGAALAAPSNRCALVRLLPGLIYDAVRVSGVSAALCVFAPDGTTAQIGARSQPSGAACPLEIQSMYPLVCAGITFEAGGGRWGVWAENRARSVFRDCWFTGGRLINSAMVQGWDLCDVVFENSVFSGNILEAGPGEWSALVAADEVRFSYCTITGNTNACPGEPSTRRGRLAIASAAACGDSILWHNPGVILEGTVMDSARWIGVDPLFEPGTLRLSWRSPCIGQGMDRGVLFDADGQLRNVPSDLGAFASVGPDADGDRLLDAWEEYYGVQVHAGVTDLDTDHDGLPDAIEYVRRTDPTDADSDADGLTDGREVNQTLTLPADPDSDDDGMPDGWEVACGTYPLQNDGLADPDGDGLDNRLECGMGTHPFRSDTDGDGFDDHWELHHGRNPVVADSDSRADPDGDGLDNATESATGTDCLSADSDGDGLDDGVEVTIGSSPLTADSDGDGLPDDVELAGTAAYSIRRSDDVSDWIGFTDSACWISNWSAPVFAAGPGGGEWIDRGNAGTVRVDIVVGARLYREMQVSADGLIVLSEGPSDGACSGDVFPDNVPLPVGDSSGRLAAYWDDLIAPATNGAWWSAGVVDGSSRVVVTWDFLSSASSTNNAIRVQAEYRADARSVTFRYQAKEGYEFLDNVSSATIGLQGAAGVPVGRFSHNRAGSVRPGTTLTFLPAITDPLNPDTDGDGVSDGDEVRLGTDPTVADSLLEDRDGDGVNLAGELAAGTDPWDPDSDGDGFSDREEVEFGMNPREPCDPAGDSDGDGLSNWDEYGIRTNPLTWDTDGDGVSDWTEDRQGSDPTDATDGGLAPPEDAVFVVQIESFYAESGNRPSNIQIEMGRFRHRSYRAGGTYSASYRLARGARIPVAPRFLRSAADCSGYAVMTADGNPFEKIDDFLYAAGCVLLEDRGRVFSGAATVSQRNRFPGDSMVYHPVVDIYMADGGDIAQLTCEQGTVELKAIGSPSSVGKYVWESLTPGLVYSRETNEYATVNVPIDANLYLDVDVKVSFTPQQGAPRSVSKVVLIKPHRRMTATNLKFPSWLALNNDNDCSVNVIDQNWPELNAPEDDVPTCEPPPAFCCAWYARQCRVTVTRESGGPRVNLHQNGTIRKTPYQLPDGTPGDQVQPFRLEGIEVSEAEKDVCYTVTMTQPGRPDVTAQKKLTVLRVDLDGDLNGDGRIDESDPDDPVESRDPGMVVDMSAQGRMPMLRVRAWLPRAPTDAKLTLSVGWGFRVRLWDGEDRRTATCVLDTTDSSHANDSLSWSVAEVTASGGATDFTSSGKIFYVEGVDAGSDIVSLRYQGDSTIVTDDIIVSVANTGMTPDFNRDGRIDGTDRLRMAEKEVFRIWINDDRDIGFEATNAEDDLPAMPGVPPRDDAVIRRTANCDDDRVNGVRDLVDFFPVLLNLPLEQFLPHQYTYTLKQGDSAVRVVFTDLRAGNVRDIHTRSMYAGFGDLGDEPPANARSYWVAGPNGFIIPARWLNRQGDKVILLEGRRRTDKPLELEISKNGRVVCRRTMGLSISPVQDMYRYLNLRTCDRFFTEHTYRYATRGNCLTRMEPPPNYPDGFYHPPGTRQMTFIAVHGLDWDETETPAGIAELFKRLFQSGMSARFIGVSWASDLCRRIGQPIIYGHDVIGAFVTAKYFKNALDPYLGPDTAILAHSLGNVLVSTSIHDHGMQIGTYFMLNAAVSVESYDGRHEDVSERRKMVHPLWKPPFNNFDESLMCASWSRLFTPGDPRSMLTWDRRFTNVVSSTALGVYTFYSTGEEVLRQPDGNLPGIICDGVLILPPPYGFWPRISSDTVAGGCERVWVCNEMTKGTIWLPPRLLPNHDHGGWGFNPNWRAPFGLPYPGARSPISVPLFNLFDTRDDPDIPAWGDSLGWLYGPDGNLIVQQRLPAGSFVSQPMARIKNHAKIMAEAIPPLSGPAGSYKLASIRGCRQFDMNTQMKDVTIWPRDRARKTRDQRDHQRWLHGDYKDMAYLYTFRLYDKIAEIMKRREAVE